LTSNLSHKKLILLAGPTAVGKTSFAIRLAQHYQTEIISADSRQFYKETVIGTAAPTTEELAAAPHHFIGNLSIHDYYNVYQFEVEALQKAEELFQVHDVVVAVGGSGLYIHALLHGIDLLPDADEKLRKEIQDRYAEEGIAYLQKEVQRLDPEFYEEVDQQNPNRLMRALEVCLTTGQKFSQLRKENSKPRPFQIIPLVLNMDREVLYDRINRRVDIMVQDGLVEEARGLYDLRHLNALKTVGYRELFTHFDGEWDLEMAIDKIKINSRRFSKRQVTWFKRDPLFQWFSPDQFEEVVTYIENLEQKK
jgi:tRNA dimethylallyltransferase